MVANADENCGCNGRHRLYRTDSVRAISPSGRRSGSRNERPHFFVGPHRSPYSIAGAETELSDRLLDGSVPAADGRNH